MSSTSMAPVRIGCCISGHGFGHACRAIAVMQALARRIPVHFTILTSAPSWLFAHSLEAPHIVHPMMTDIGLVQQNALTEDLTATLAALDRLYPLSADRVGQAAALLSGCELVWCDIAPLGIAAAKQAGIRSVLMENFTWDWIYQGYVERCPGLQAHIEYLRPLFQQADHHIQAMPVCRPLPCDRTVAPVARTPRHPERIRQRLFCEPGQRLVVLTMGGIEAGKSRSVRLEPLVRQHDTVFVGSGWSRETEFTGNLRFLAHDGPWYHPDLVAAADLVVGKTGYSTVAEAYQGGTAYAYVDRPGFRESAVLEEFLAHHLLSWKMEPAQWESGAWLAHLSCLPAVKPSVPRPDNGADQTADYLMELLRGGTNGCS